MGDVINGTVVDINGDPVQGATVYAIQTDVTPAEVVGQDTTDVSGVYSIEFPRGGEAHIAAEWDGVNGTFNSRSRPFVQVETDIPDSGIARHNFDNENSDVSVLKDVWGDNDGDAINATFVSGGDKDGSGSYSFNGNSTEIESTNQLSPKSIHVRFKPDRTFTGNDAREWILGQSPSESENISIHLGNWTGDFDGETTGILGKLYDPTLNADQWYEITITDDGTDWTLYLDGTELTSIGTKTNPAQNVTFTPTYGYRASEGDEHFGGEIGEARYYDKELTQTEVSNLHNTGSING